MSNTGWAVTIVVIIIILGGGWWWYSSTQAPAAPATTDTTANGAAVGTTDTSATAGAQAGAGAGQNAANTTVIHFTASGFSPKSVTVPVGATVEWVDDTQSPMWVASNSHPTHTGYDGTDRTTHCAGNYTGPTPFDECAAGNDYRFVFTKAGTFGFHNHMAAQFEGTVTVH